MLGSNALLLWKLLKGRITLSGRPAAEIAHAAHLACSGFSTIVIFDSNENSPWVAGVTTGPKRIEKLPGLSVEFSLTTQDILEFSQQEICSILNN